MWEAVNPDLKEGNSVVIFVSIPLKGNWVKNMTKLTMTTLEETSLFSLSITPYRKPYLKIFITIEVQFWHLRRVLMASGLSDCWNSMSKGKKERGKQKLSKL